MVGHRVFSAFVLAALVLCLPHRSSAIPLLQLEIKGGVYDSVTETTVATSNAFTLYAYLTPGKKTSAAELQAMLNDTYYISAALTPQVSSPADLGSFSFNGTTVDATSDMVYGNPPIEYLGGADRDSGDLSKHGIYNTYFKEFAFKFTSGPAIAYDVQDAPFDEPTDAASGGMYYAAFTVDTSLLSPLYQVHFDLYNTVKDGNDVNINKFAPFSHDARSRGFGGDDLVPLPEPGSIILFTTGAVALVAAGYRRRRRQ